MKQHVPPPKRYILIVEDDDLFREAMAIALRTAGYETVTAKTMTEAIGLSDNYPLAMAIVDIMLGGHRIAITELERLKQANPQMLILLMSGYNCLENAAQRYYPTVDAFITKPCQRHELLKLVEALMAKRDSEMKHKV